MSDFGDDDPEDGYDVSDSIPERLGNVELRLLWLIDHLLQHDRPDGDLVDHLVRVRDDLRTVRNQIVDAVEAVAGHVGIEHFTRSP